MPSTIDDKRLDAFVSLSLSRPGQLQNIDYDPIVNGTRTAAIITVYIALSASVDLYNRYIWSTLEFPYPVVLVTSQLVVTALGSTVYLQLVDVDSAHLQTRTRMSRGIFLRCVVPIGILFSGSLLLSNQAFLHLSVCWIQIPEAFVPVAVLFARIPVRDASRVFAIILMVSFGVAVASYSSSYALRIFDMLGFGMQALAVMFEASRLVMLEILLHETKIHPLVALQYSASVRAVFTLIVLAFTEGLDPFLALPWVLLGNALLAFGMNIAAMYLIDVASGLVLTLAGVLKDILLFTSSALMFGEPISGIQVVGYSIAFGGLVLYNIAK
ncbi:TPT-domain-containing protein [Exidia glandulosa HHB12029]|uniref:TPT-domain-containing protein n=1 Tax=Exidia glandulosa HHB12029 TaxID=1314781 RepID=A0A165LP14_EXIGL|nr:TPT-domain-containing protein [Exidia glandulosa HHB12029]